jgi:hypothetical protein
MNLFEKKTAPDEPVTGVTALRQTVAARNKSPHALTAIAREIDGVGVAALEAFGTGRANLSIGNLQKLTKVLYGGHAEFDPDSGMLRSAYRAEPKPLCAAYPKFAAPPSMGLGSYENGAPQPVKPEKPKEKKSRPGWIGGLF